MKKQLIYATKLLITLFLFVTILISAVFFDIEKASAEILPTTKELVDINNIINDKTNENSFVSDSNIIYDLNGDPLYLYVRYSNGSYSISIRENNTILERGEGLCAYENKNSKLYYGGVGNYFYEINNCIKDIENDGEIPSEMRQNIVNYMEDIRNKAQVQYNEEKTAIVPYGASNRSNIKKLGNDNTKYNYFNDTINPYAHSGHFESALGSLPGETVPYGVVFYLKVSGNENYDVMFPKNNRGTCGPVAMTMLLQYYKRLLGYNNLIPASFTQYCGSSSDLIATSLGITSTGETIHRELESLTYVLPGSGAAPYNLITDGFGRYLSKYSINVTPRCFTSYTGMKDELDKGNPCIISVGSGDGYFWNGNAWQKDGVSGHNLVAYGYTTNSFNIMDEFVCHTGWHNSQVNSGCYFVNKLLVAGNASLKVL